MSQCCNKHYYVEQMLSDL